MAKAFNQKTKILYLLQMLMEQTDENHVLNMQQILQALEEKEIRAERKSIYDDFDVLRKFGFDVRFRKGQPSGYYLAERRFAVHDVQMLIDLLPEGEESELLESKLKALLSTYQAEEIKRAVPVKAVESEPFTDESTVPSEGEKIRIQLLFKEKHMDAVKAHPDCTEDVREHKSGVYKAWMETVVDKSFYGWMVGQGFGIKIVKPKNEAEAYRLHLKKLLKQYK